MASLGQTYNNDSIERQVMSGGPLPSGTYLGGISNATQKETKKKDGLYLDVEFDIIEPSEYQNRKVWDKLNFRNPNQTTQKIAAEQIEDLRQACGLKELNDDQQLVGCMVQMEIVVDAAIPYKDQYGKDQPGSPSNRIIKYHHVSVNVEEAKANRKAKKGGAAPATNTQQSRPTVPTQQVQQSPAQQSGGLPWKRHKPA